MSYRLEPDESVAEGVRRIAQEQLQKALGEMDDPDLGVHETIHQIRKRCKKLRGLVRLVRPAVPDLYDRENTIFRDVARTVSDARDATAYLEAYDALMTHFAEEVDRSAFGPIRRTLTERRTALVERQDVDERLAAFRETLVEAQDRVQRWQISVDGYDAVRDGLQKTYKRGWKGQRRAYDDPSDENFHEWRKRAKYHRYHMKLLRNLWDPLVNERRHKLHDLTDLLGDDHDLAEFKSVIEEEPDVFGDLDHLQAFLGLMDRRRGELQARSRPLGLRVYAEEPPALVERFGGYWRAWSEAQAQNAEHAAPRTLVAG
jgi:CHAD domain-containing protein